MTANAPKTYDIEVEDVEYIRHGDTPLLARLFKPRGPGPFPLIVDLHGGTWNLGDRLMDAAISYVVYRCGTHKGARHHGNNDQSQSPTAQR